MTAIPHAAGVLSNALGRFERASMRRLEAATVAAEDDEIVTPVEAVTKTRARTRSGTGSVGFSDQVWSALIEAQSREGEAE